MLDLILNPFFWIFIVLIFLLLGIAQRWVRIYNRFQNVKQIVKKCFASIQLSMQQRLILMDSMTQILLNYRDHEYGSFKDVTNARQGLVDGDVNTAVKSAQEIEKGFINLKATFENYPNLKADRLYQNIVGKDSISGLESRLRNDVVNYNLNVQIYNREVHTFPEFIVARVHGFKEFEYFAFPEVQYVKTKIFNDKKDSEVA